MAAIPFDQLYDAVQALKAKPDVTSDQLDKVIIEAGHNPADYKSRVAQLRQGSGGPLGGGGMEAFAKGFTDTATFGHADELGALLDATSGLVEGKGNFSDLYNKSVEDRRVSAAEFGKKYPKTTLAGGLVGGAVEAPMLPGLSPAATWAGTAVRGAAEGAAAGGLYGFGSGRDTLGDRLAHAATGAATGGAAGGLIATAARGASAGLGALAGRPGMAVADASGNLTPEAAQALQAAGMDPNSVTPAIGAELAQRLAGRRADAQSVPAMVRTIYGEQAGVPLAAAQATRSNKALGQMQEMSAGVHGSRAENTVNDFFANQQQQFNTAADAAAQRVAPGAVGGYRESGAGEYVAQGVNREADNRWQAVQNLYRTTGADRAVVPAHDTANLIPDIMSRLQRSNFNAVRPERAPTFTDAIDTLRANVVGQDTTLAHLDDVRKSLGEMIRDPNISNTDRAMTRHLLSAFDDWLDNAVNAQASTLPGAALTALQGARTAARNWFQTFQRDPLNRGDTVGPLMENIRNGKLDNSDLFDKLMGSSSAFDEKALPLGQHVRDILGAGSPEWQTLQQGMVRRILFGNADKQAQTFQPGEQAWQTMVSRINKALEGSGERLSTEMLGPDAVAQLRQLREVAKSLVVGRKAGNPSGSGYTMQRGGADIAKTLMQTILTGGGASLGFSTGGPAGAIAGAAGGVLASQVASAARNIRGGQRAANMLESYRPPTNAPPGLENLGMLFNAPPATSGELSAKYFGDDAETRGKRNLLGLVPGARY